MIVAHVRLRRIAGGDPPRHAEMKQQQAVRVELDQNVFATAGECADPGAVEPLGQCRRKRPAQIGPAQFGAHDPAAAHLQREAAPDRLDFGQFGHSTDGFRTLRPRRGARGPMALSSCPMSEEETSRTTGRDYRHIAADEKAPLVRGIFDSVARHYDLMNDLMSGGIHRLWKAEMVAWLNPRPGQLLIDVAGGTGDVALRALPRLVPESGIAEGAAFVCDTNESMLEIGRARALDRGILYGIEWLGADAERLPFAERSFDLYTIAFGLRNVTRIEAALAEARRVLKPGGRFLCLEFTPQVAPLLQPLYDLYSFHVVPLLGRIVTGDREAYTYLVESIRGFPRQGELADLIIAAGLEQVRYHNLTGGIAVLHSAWRL